ncbi:MAG: substrate-binding domain-containing protein [Clostridiales bacterium]|nr:substrate-binding domain-containing protein [Clostridiales bacterium]
MAKSLDNPSTLTLQDNPPRLDGLKHYYPLASAFAKAAYPANMVENALESRFDPFPIVSLGCLLQAENDIAFLKRSDVKEAREEIIALSNSYPTSTNPAISALGNTDLTLTPIAKDALIFFVNSQNPIADLSLDAIKGIYTDRITNWDELGGKRQSIKAYIFSDESSRFLRNFFDGIKLKSRVYEFSFSNSMFPSPDFKNYNNAIGFTSFFHLDKIQNNPDPHIRVISIDGVAPTAENIANGTYPITDDICAVTIVTREYKDENEKARIENSGLLIEWILSEQGQELIEKTGYVRLSS